VYSAISTSAPNTLHQKYDLKLRRGGRAAGGAGGLDGLLEVGKPGDDMRDSSRVAVRG
jgi:hypothetical protein